MRNQDIAAKLNLSEDTVRNYLFRFFDKLDISSRVELVLYAFSGAEGTPALSGPTLLGNDAKAGHKIKSVHF